MSRSRCEVPGLLGVGFQRNHVLLSAVIGLASFPALVGCQCCGEREPLCDVRHGEAPAGYLVDGTILNSHGAQVAFMRVEIELLAQNELTGEIETVAWAVNDTDKEGVFRGTGRTSIYFVYMVFCDGVVVHSYRVPEEPEPVPIPVRAIVRMDLGDSSEELVIDLDESQVEITEPWFHEITLGIIELERTSRPVVG